MSWEDKVKIEAEATLVEAKAALARTDPEVISAALEAKQMEADADVRTKRAEAFRLAVSYAPHFVWALAAVAITWILVVCGWRG